MKTYLVKAYDIKYCIEKEDVYDFIDNTIIMKNDEDYLEKVVKDLIRIISNKLPEELIVEVTCEREELPDQTAYEISDVIGWLVNSFNYKVMN